ncbi:MAG: hypothetical protein HC923_11230, partial [Myxococcales bacterium]|nr:hypothetical protein [Myxococcales bacterium]
MRTTGDVRRRLAEGAVWNSLGAGQDLFPGDWVQTAVAATAQVSFDDGSMLFVEPSTTVVIDEQRGEDDESLRRVAIESGTIRAGLRPGSRRPVQSQLARRQDDPGGEPRRESS